MSYQARKIKLKPNQAQVLFFKRNMGAARFVWNWGLALQNKWWEENKDKEKEKGEREKRPSRFDLGKQLNVLKHTHEEYSWLKEIDSRVILFALDSLDKAFKRFFSGKARHPRFKSRKGSRQSYTTKTLSYPKLKDENHILLPKIGSCKFYNRGYIPSNSTIKQATISTDGDHFYCSVLVDIPVKSLPNPPSNSIVGIDLGIKTTVTCSDGKTYHLPRQRKLEKRIRRAQRTLSRRCKTSARREKARTRLRKLHRKASNRRTDFIHKTTTSIVSENQAIRMEDLNTRGMLKNHHLASSLSHSSFGEIKRQLEYKSAWYNRSFETVGRWFPSSQLCSRCGTQNKEMRDLKKRTFECPVCGFSMDRDLNAAINIRDCTPGDGETGALVGTNAQGDLHMHSGGSSPGCVAGRRTGNCKKTYKLSI